MQLLVNSSTNLPNHSAINNKMRPTQAQAFHPENIPTAIAQCRPDGEVPVLERHFDGGQCRVYKVVFSNKESWAVRIPLHVQSSSKEAMIDVMKGELDTVLELNRKSFPWVAKYHGSSFTFENPVGYPFLAFSWLEGIPLPWSEPELPRPSRNKVLWQLAELQVTLIECTKEKSVSSLFPAEVSAHHSRRDRYGLFQKSDE